MYPVNQTSSAGYFRRVVSFLLALIAVGSLIFLPGMAIDVHAAKTVTISNPADYFGSVDKTVKLSSRTSYYFDGYSSYPSSKVTSYIKALKDDGLTGGTVKDSGSDKRATLKYQNNEKLWIVWDKSKKQICVNVSNDLSVAKATGTSTTTETTPTKPTETAKSAAVSNPADYFGSVDKTVKLSSRTSYYFDGYSSYPSSKVTSYIKALKDDGLTGGTVKDSGSDKRATLKYQNNEKLWIVWDKSKKQICVNVSNDLSVAKAGSTTANSTATPSIVDMITDIFGKHDKLKEHDNYTLYSFYTSSYPSSNANTFVTKLKDLGLKEVKKYDRTDGSKCYEYQWNNEVLIKIWNYPKKNKDDEFMIGVFWDILKESGKFDKADIPDESVPPAPTGGGVSTPCMECSGGSCRECGGSGEIKKMVIGKPGEYTTKTCSRCYGLKKCPTCDGRGWVD